MKGPYRLLAIDLDGTLIGNGPDVSPRSVRAIKAAARTGVTVTIATGRMFPSSRPYAELLGITAPIICYQGAQLRDPVSGGVIEETLVDRDTAREVIDYCKQRGYHVNAFLNYKVYMSELTDAGRFYTDRANVEPQVVGDLGSWLKGREHDPAALERLCTGIRVRSDKNGWEVELNILDGRGGVDVGLRFRPIEAVADMMREIGQRLLARVGDAGRQLKGVGGDPDHARRVGRGAAEQGLLLDHDDVETLRVEL